MLRFSKVRVCVRPVAVLSGCHVGGGGAIQETSVPRVCATVPHPPLLHPPTSPPLSLRHVCQGSHWSPRRVENSPRSAQDIRSSLYTDTYVCMYLWMKDPLCPTIILVLLWTRDTSVSLTQSWHCTTLRLWVPCYTLKPTSVHICISFKYNTVIPLSGGPSISTIVCQFSARRWRE